jgi:predicted pyridoxine 5'-phosphate oxidase superfamily flavin-nucleotide-binding protein
MKVRLIGNTKYHQIPHVFKKGDVFDIDPVAFVPLVMEDLTPKAILVVKIEPVSAPKEEGKPKAAEKKKTGK